jgi:carbamoyl-phosphate synthase large subunit
VLLSLGPVEDKYWFADEARMIVEDLRLPIYATHGTAEMLWAIDIPCTSVAKKAGNSLSALDIIDDGRVDLVINVPREYDEYGRPDGYLIRRCAVDAGVPLITDLQLARAIIEALCWKKERELGMTAWDEYVNSALSQ